MAKRRGPNKTGLLVCIMCVCCMLLFLRVTVERKGVKTEVGKGESGVLCYFPLPTKQETADMARVIGTESSGGYAL